MKQNYTCCFFGHRKIIKTQELIQRLTNRIEALITEKTVNTFYFGSKSEDDYKNYLLESYEETYFPEKMRTAGKASYVERNQEMVNKSDFCVVYYDESYLPPRRKNSKRDIADYQPESGTKMAYCYAVKKKKKIINVFE